MLQLDGKTLQYDKAFKHDGYQYPANWLRLTSLEEKQAIGIVEVADPVDGVYDQRFYWGLDNPKQLNDKTETIDGVEVTTTGLKTTWKETQNQIAASLLAPSDWRVTKAAELGTTVASIWLTYRGAVRSACNTRQSEITAVETVEALRELFYGEATITRQKTDADGNGLVEPDTITIDGKEEANPKAGEPVMETVDNPGLATAWPDSPS